jgi:hypothetical protein
MQSKHIARCAALLAFPIVLVASCRFGIGLSPDSVGYLSVARNILHSGLVMDYTGTPFVGQPPLYPLLLAFLSRLSGFEVTVVIPWLNAVLFGAALYLFAVVIQQVVHETRLHLPLVILGALASPLVDTAIFAWSELLYINLMMLFLYLGIQLTARPRFSLLVGFILVAALATLTRYIGVTLIMSGALILLRFWKAAPVRRFTTVLLFIFASSLPVVLWWLRNYLLTHTLMGPRASSMFSLLENGRFVLETVVGWFLPKRCQILPGYSMACVAFLVLAALALSWKVTRRWMFAPADHPLPAAVWQKLVVPAIVAAIYCAFLLVTSTTTAYDRIGDRLLSPMYLLFLIGLALPPWTRPVRILLFVALLGASVSKSGKQVWDAASQGKGFAAEEWRQSELAMRLKSWNRAGQFYSNVPEAVYLFGGRNCQLLPQRYKGHNTREETEPLTRDSASCLLGNYIAYFQDHERTLARPYLYSLSELATIIDMQRLESCRDGAIYQAVEQP